MGLAFQYNWGSPHPAGALFVAADGSVRVVPHDSDAARVQAFLTPKGGEVFEDF